MQYINRTTTLLALEDDWVARVIAVANQKGGSGKTTTTRSLASTLAELGRTVLMVDLDPQGSLSEGCGVEGKRLTDGALQFFTSQDWPGNVRQLENVCHWVTVMAPGQVVDVKDLPAEVRGESAATAAGR